jgi:putative membrane protein
MGTVSNVLVGLVAFLHVYFLVLEMFLWATPYGAKTFKRPLAEMVAMKSLAANQGLYNGFLAAGLVWSLTASEPFGYSLKLFFLGCVIVAGLYGAATASRTILFVQAVPGVAALVATLVAR